MSCPDRDPYAREHADDDLICAQCLAYPRAAGLELCERCQLFQEARRARAEQR